MGGGPNFSAGVHISLFIKKLVPGGTNFGGSIFTMTVATMCLTIEHLRFRDKITELQIL